MKNIYYPLSIKQFQLSIVHSVIMDTGLNVNMKEICAQDKDGGVLDYCQLHDITIQPWSILQASWSEGSFINHSDYQKLNKVLNALADKYHVTPSAIATAWLLRHPASSQPICGYYICQAFRRNI